MGLDAAEFFRRIACQENFRHELLGRSQLSADGDAQKVFGRWRFVRIDEFGCGRVRGQKFVRIFGGEGGSSSGG